MRARVGQQAPPTLPSVFRSHITRPFFSFGRTSYCCWTGAHVEFLFFRTHGVEWEKRGGAGAGMMGVNEKEGAPSTGCVHG